MCVTVTIMIAQTHFSSLRHAHGSISSRTIGQVAALRVTGLIIKRLWLNYCYCSLPLPVQMEIARRVRVVYDHQPPFGDRVHQVDRTPTRIRVEDQLLRRVENDVLGTLV